MQTVAYYAHLVTGLLVFLMFIDQLQGEGQKRLYVPVLLTEIAHIWLVGANFSRYLLEWNVVQHQPIEGAAVAYWIMTTVMATSGIYLSLRAFSRNRKNSRQGRVIGSPFK